MSGRFLEEVKGIRHYYELLKTFNWKLWSKRVAYETWLQRDGNH